MVYLKKKIKKIKNGKEGFTSLFVILLSAAILPILIFFLIEMSNYIHIKDEATSLNTRMTNQAIRSIDFENSTEDLIMLDEAESATIASNLFIRNYNLNSSYEPNTGSPLSKKPQYSIDFLYPDVVDNKYVETDVYVEGNAYVTINNPAVFVYTEVNPKGFFYDMDLTFKNYSIFEVVLKNNELEEDLSLSDFSYKRLIVKQ